MAGDLAALVADHDLARADPGGDAQPDQRDRDRVAVLPDRDQRLLIDPRRQVPARVDQKALVTIRRSSSAKQPSSSRSLSSFNVATFGTGTRRRRRKRPTSPSTPPFS